MSDPDPILRYPYVRFALQDLVQSVVEEVTEPSDRLREVLGFAKQILAATKEETSDRRGDDTAAK